MGTKKEQFEKLYSSFRDKVYRLCYGYIHDRDIAEDLTQECFIKVWEHMESFRDESNASTWIYRIAVNTCLMQIRKNKKENTIYGNKIVVLTNVAEEGHPAKEENIENLYKAIQKLQETDRVLISMVLDDLPYNEIGEVLGITENLVGVKVHRIKKQLQKYL